MSTDENRNITNYGSALGEALGAAIEKEVNRILGSIAEDNNCIYKTAGPPDPRHAKETKLLISDTSGNQFHIDSVITNQKEQPLIIIESKYIRYKKHNRDKGSWICTAHSSLRRAYPTIRMSIAVLLGSWSKPSKALMESFDVTLFEVNFQKIVDVLAQYNIDFAWKEKEREKAKAAWEAWQNLKDSDHAQIAQTLLAEVEPALRNSIKTALDTTIAREITGIEMSLKTNVGEQRFFTFNDKDQALHFLTNIDEAVILDDENGPSLLKTINKKSGTSRRKKEQVEPINKTKLAATKQNRPQRQKRNSPHQQLPLIEETYTNKELPI